MAEPVVDHYSTLACGVREEFIVRALSSRFLPTKARSAARIG